MRPSSCQHSTSSELDRAFRIMEKASLRKTQARIALLESLISKHGPFSVEELHQIVKSQKVDLVTVYRCLTAFEQIGLVKRCYFGDGIARYEFQTESDHHHHHHVICRICRKAENIDDREVERLEKLVQKMGY